MLDGLGRVRRVKAKPADTARFASLDTAATAKAGTCEESGEVIERECVTETGMRYPPLRWPDDRTCKIGPDPSFVPGILLPHKITVKGAHYGRVFDGAKMAQRPRQDHRHLSEGRGRARRALDRAGPRTGPALT